mgnify:CR=1 FL=1
MEQYKEHQDQKITRQNFISCKTGGTYDMSLLFYTFLFCYLSKFVLEIWLCLIKCICHIYAVLEDIIQSNSCELCIDGRIGRRRMRFKTCASIFELFHCCYS